MTKEKGQMFVLAIIVVTLILVNVLVVISGAFYFRQSSNYYLAATGATNLAEAGIDKAVASLNATAGSYSGETGTQLGGGLYDVSITTLNSTTKLVKATGYVPNKSNPASKKAITIQVSKGIGAAFNYGIQIGEGGLRIKQPNGLVNGSIYSNGSIDMSSGNNAKITGDVYVAGGIQPTPDQQEDCSTPNCSDFIFGKSVSGQSILDVAQSFQPSSSNVLSKVSLKLKKVGTPADLTVRLIADNGGKPGGTVLSSGTLNASLVTGNYSFVDIIFSNPSNPSVTSGTTYWVVVDTSSDSSNYWVWSNDTTSGYTKGAPMWSPDWSVPHPTWNSISGDLGFKTYMGGVPTYISGNGQNKTNIGGDVHANTLQNLVVTGGAYYQVQTGTTAGSFHPNSTDPVALNTPLSDANIAEWKNTASSLGVHAGDITSCPGTLAAGKYIGNINFSGCSVTVGSPIWVTGSLSMGDSSTLKLDPSIGGSSGVFIVDGQITLGQSNKIAGSGQSGSYLILLSNYNTRDDPNKKAAIILTNKDNTGIVYTNLGRIDIQNSNNLTEITGWEVDFLYPNITVTYDQGLASAFFSSGPGGSYSVIKGTYQAQ